MWWHGGAGLKERSERGMLPAVATHVLCVRSMRRYQKGFKSPVNRMNIEEQKKLLTMKSTTRSQLREGDRPWEGRLWENCQTMNKKLIRGRLSGMSWHNTAKSRHSTQEVNGSFGQGRFQGLPTEASATSGHGLVAAQPSAMADVIAEESAEVIVPESRTGRMKEA